MSSTVKGTDFEKRWKYPMQSPFLEKLVINIGIGSLGAQELQKATKVLAELSGKEPNSTKATKNIKEWNIRRGQTCGVMVTLRKEEAKKMLKRVLVVYDNRILRAAFDNKGNFSFGLDEHIKIPDTRYDPDLGIFGMNFNGKITRPGFRIKYRKKDRRKIGKDHYVSREEAIQFMQKKMNVEIVDILEERFY